MKRTFNSSIKFNKGLTKLLFNEYKSKLFNTIEYCIETNDINSLNKIVKLLDTLKFDNE